MTHRFGPAGATRIYRIQIGVRLLRCGRPETPAWVCLQLPANTSLTPTERKRRNLDQLTEEGASGSILDLQIQLYCSRQYARQLALIHSASRPTVEKTRASECIDQDFRIYRPIGRCHGKASFIDGCGATVGPTGAKVWLWRNATRSL